MSLIKLLSDLPDARRGQGRRYELNLIIVCSILSILAGARSYRDIHRFIKVNHKNLNQLLGINWKRVPAHTTLRDILKGIKQQTLEWYFRQYSNYLKSDVQLQDRILVAIDGKVLKGSFDNTEDKGSLNLISAYCSNNDFIIGHIETEDKSNEIPAVQKMLGGLGLKDCIYTMDALHCQKKRLI